jgi:hypothetical protein
MHTRHTFIQTLESNEVAGFQNQGQMGMRVSTSFPSRPSRLLIPHVPTFLLSVAIHTARSKEAHESYRTTPTPCNPGRSPTRPAAQQPCETPPGAPLRAGPGEQAWQRPWLKEERVRSGTLPKGPPGLSRTKRGMWPLEG